MSDMGGDIPILPFGETQWARFKKAKAEGTEWFGYAYQDDHWERVPDTTDQEGRSDG